MILHLVHTTGLLTVVPEEFFFVLSHVSYGVLPEKRHVWQVNLWGDRAGGQNFGSFGGFRRLVVRFGLCRWQQDESLKMLGIHSQRWNDCKQMHSRCVQLFRRSKTHAFCRPWQLLCILRSCIHMVFQDQEYVTTLISAISHRNLLKIIGLWNGGCQITIRRTRTITITITAGQEGGGGAAPSPQTLVKLQNERHGSRLDRRQEKRQGYLQNNTTCNNPPKNARDQGKDARNAQKLQKKQDVCRKTENRRNPRQKALKQNHSKKMKVKQTARKILKQAQ